MTTPTPERQDRWDASYQRRENFVFSPNEQLVRFISRYVRRRTGLSEFADILAPPPRPLRLLDLGCGIGRHVVFAQEMGLQAYGIDLSPVAIDIARAWVTQCGFTEAAKFLHVGSVTQLPFEDGFFQVAVSHGVLDSMTFDIAEQALGECARVLSPGGLFYCDLISGDDSRHGREFAGEEIVTTEHERDTVQSYFNFARIQKLFAGRFDILEAVLVKSENLLAPISNARTHLVLKKR
jgi:ubiquinone/menaquinone biosynthesis C-methylase UbiE